MPSGTASSARSSRSRRKSRRRSGSWEPRSSARGRSAQKQKKKTGPPADLAGIKLRMPPGDAWQLLGRSLGANPTPMAYAETYTGLQTGAIDGQDNPLPNVQAMKFYEVMSQI